MRKNFNKEKLDKMSVFFKTISDKTRLKILLVLKNGPKNVGEISEEVDISQSAISHQLKILKFAKLISSIKQGKHVYYEYLDDHVYQIIDQTIEHMLEDNKWKN